VRRVPATAVVGACTVCAAAIALASRAVMRRRRTKGAVVIGPHAPALLVHHRGQPVDAVEGAPWRAAMQQLAIVFVVAHRIAVVDTRAAHELGVGGEHGRLQHEAHRARRVHVRRAQVHHRCCDAVAKGVGTRSPRCGLAQGISVQLVNQHSEVRERVLGRRRASRPASVDGGKRVDERWRCARRRARRCARRCARRFKWWWPRRWRRRRRRLSWRVQRWWLWRWLWRCGGCGGTFGDRHGGVQGGGGVGDG
jgi:hypothetical protein